MVTATAVLGLAPAALGEDVTVRIERGLLEPLGASGADALDAIHDSHLYPCVSSRRRCSATRTSALAT